MSYLYRRHFPRSTTHTLDTDTSRTGKEIQHVDAFEIDAVIQ